MTLARTARVPYKYNYLIIGIKDKRIEQFDFFHNKWLHLWFHVSEALSEVSVNSSFNLSCPINRLPWLNACDVQSCLVAIVNRHKFKTDTNFIDRVVVTTFHVERQKVITPVAPNKRH